MSTKRERSEAGRRLSRMRKPTKRTCAVCGTGFNSVDARAMYCGNTCKCASYRARRDAK